MGETGLDCNCPFINECKSRNYEYFSENKVILKNLESPIVDYFEVKCGLL